MALWYRVFIVQVVSGQSRHTRGFYEEVGNVMDNVCNAAKMTFEGLLGPENCDKCFQKNHSFWKA
jgi:hypothetical protein